MPISNPYVLQTIKAQLNSEPIGPRSVKHLTQSDASTNLNVAKDKAGKFYKAEGYNASFNGLYLRIYDSFSPIVGQSQATILKYCPPQEQFIVDFSTAPIPFVNGISFAFTGSVEDGDSTPIGESEIRAFNLYYS